MNNVPVYEHREGERKHKMPAVETKVFTRTSVADAIKILHGFVHDC